MRPIFIEEPELEFGGGGRHIDIRHGLTQNGPLDVGSDLAPKVVRLGVIGATKDIDAFKEWVEKCQKGLPAKESPRKTLFVPFPGFGSGQHFCDFVIEPRQIDSLTDREQELLLSLGRDEFFTKLSMRFEEGATHLIDNASADVVVCLLPESFVRRIDVPDRPDIGPRSQRKGKTEGEDVWHDLFKARALKLRRPLQIIRPGTYSAGAWRFRRDGKAVRVLQDEATRAWNVFVALYYKAGGIPWRLTREVTDCPHATLG